MATALSPSPERGEELVNYIPELSPTRLADLPTILHSEDQTLLFALQAKYPFPVYSFGPLVPCFNLQPNASINTSHNESDYRKWLDSQPESSVLYVSTGSFLSISSALNGRNGSRVFMTAGFGAMSFFSWGILDSLWVEFYFGKCFCWGANACSSSIHGSVPKQKTMAKRLEKGSANVSRVTPSIAAQMQQPKVLWHSLRGLRHISRGHGSGDEGLGLANGSALLELDIVADLELVVGVLGLELLLLLLPDPALVLGVWGEARDLDGHDLVVGGAHNAALQRLHG
ncbi:ribosomal protein S17 [Actinidia rufa]|uniref:Ribosomal protein S17 n=1 Tax=Actinidia rufa TaxID=165716 RepID=A0A7J0DLV8_9ERIC|nr:ribosomal protein S17 [Actinidia rufa]